MYLQTEATECGDTTVPPLLHRRWRYAPKVPDKEFKNPRFGQYYWQGNEKYTADRRLYPNKIAEYEEGGLFEELECALIENEEDRITYECDDTVYSTIETYRGKRYYYYTLTVYNEGEEIEAVHMVERRAEGLDERWVSLSRYVGYRKGRFEQRAAADTGLDNEFFYFSAVFMLQVVKVRALRAEENKEAGKDVGSCFKALQKFFCAA